MEIKNFTITKRDGSKDLFSLDKIMSAIIKAFESVYVPADLGAISKILSHLDIKNDIKVEDVENQVEVALMQEGHFSVAKNFNLQRKRLDRKTIERLRFLFEYCKSERCPAESKNRYGRFGVKFFQGHSFEEIDKKLNTRNSKSENKQILKRALQNISDNASKEEIIQEIEQVIEDNKIDRRVFNGRDEEHDFCESLTNDQVWDVFVECYERFMHGTLETSKNLCLYIQAFAKALYDTIGKMEFVFDGKLSFIHRFAESKLGKALSFGVRAIQKGLSKFAAFLKHGSVKENECWKEKEEQRYSYLSKLVENIKGAFVITLSPAN